MVNRTQRRSRATEQAIVAAAEDLLAEGGIDAVTLEAVSNRADVAIQTIYNRVGGRPALLMAVAESAFEANRAYLAEAHAADAGAIERLRGVAAAYVRFALEKPNQYRLLAFPPAGAPAPDRVASLVREQNGKLEALIAEAVQEGLFRGDLDPAMIATVLWRTWDGVLALMFRTDGLRPTAEALSEILAATEAIMELGLRAR